MLSLLEKMGEKGQRNLGILPRGETQSLGEVVARKSLSLTRSEYVFDWTERAVGCS